MKLAIYGSGGVGLPAKAIAEKLGRWDEIIFVDDTKPASVYKDCLILPFDEFKEKYTSKEVEFVIAVGSPVHRKKLYDKVKKEKYTFTNLISPDATLCDDVKLGVGIIIERVSFVGFGVEISDNVFISGGACISHGASIDKHCVILHYSILGGLSKIGSTVFIGQNSTIKDRITVGDNALVSMCAAVFHDVPSSKVVLGNPARVVADNSEALLYK